MTQRKPEDRFSLGKTTGWIHRLTLGKKLILNTLSLSKITPEGLVVEQDGKQQFLMADNIILCTGNALSPLFTL